MLLHHSSDRLNRAVKVAMVVVIGTLVGRFAARQWLRDYTDDKEARALPDSISLLLAKVLIHKTSCGIKPRIAPAEDRRHYICRALADAVNADDRPIRAGIASESVEITLV